MTYYTYADTPAGEVLFTGTGFQKQVWAELEKAGIWCLLQLPGYCHGNREGGIAAKSILLRLERVAFSA